MISELLLGNSVQESVQNDALAAANNEIRYMKYLLFYRRLALSVVPKFLLGD